MRQVFLNWTGQRQAAVVCMSYIMKCIRSLQLPVSFFALAIGFSSCQNPASNTLSKFKKIDSSLSKSNILSAHNDLERLNEHIQAKKNNAPRIALLADTFYLATLKTIGLLDSLKQVIIKLDSSGERTDIGNDLLLNPTTSAKLTNYLKYIYTISDGLLSYEEHKHIDSTFTIFKDVETNENWTNKYFGNSPGIGVAVILSKIKNDCFEFARFTLFEALSKIEKITVAYHSGLGQLRLQNMVGSANDFGFFKMTKCFIDYSADKFLF